MNDRETKIIALSDHRAPVCYSVHISHEWDGHVRFWVSDVSLESERSRQSIAITLRELADRIEHMTDEDVERAQA